MGEIKVNVYDAGGADEYDEKSHFDKGDRERQRQYLADVTGFLNKEIKLVIELGCGTGFFTETLLQLCPAAKIVALDGAGSMLALAREKLAGRDQQVLYRQCDLRSADLLEWQGAAELVFSAFTLCFLSSAERAAIIRQSWQALAEGGALLIIDQFLPASQQARELVEYLACRDLQRRFAAFLGAPLTAPSLALDKIIAMDRKQKLHDGERETSIEEHVTLVRAAGFDECHEVFRDGRVFGLLAIKGAAS